MGEPPIVTAFEFFSGIGGLHYALRDSGMPHKVVRAYDVDDSAVKTYRANLPETTVSTQNIASLKAVDLQPRADCWLLSPPCQPYSRQGLQLQGRDSRAAAMQHIIDLLELDEADELRPTWLLLENVVGFESSGTRKRLYSVLSAAGYAIRELWCSPAMIGVPNQRTRYFLLAAKGREMPSELPDALGRAVLLDPQQLAAACDASSSTDGGAPLPPPRGEVSAEMQASCAPLSQYLLPAGSPELGELGIGEHNLERYGRGMDLVGRASRRSCCFTKNYSRYFKGTGSLVCEAGAAAGGVETAAAGSSEGNAGGGGGEGNPADGAGSPQVAESAATATQPDGAASGSASGAVAALVLQDKSLEALRPLRPRFFAPREIARLHGFPETFAFPRDGPGRKKQFELLGNSLSVQVVATLLRHMLFSSKSLHVDQNASHG